MSTSTAPASLLVTWPPPEPAAQRFADPPAEVWATLLDEGTYIGPLSAF